MRPLTPPPAVQVVIEEVFHIFKYKNTVKTIQFDSYITFYDEYLHEIKNLQNKTWIKKKTTVSKR